MPPQQGYAAFTAQWWQPADLSGSDDRVWWLGHAALLLRINQRYILIDPALSQRASPLNIRDLPRLDLVLVSHNHYDHLDKATVKQIVRHFPQARFMVPLGLAPWFTRQGVTEVEQLDWWQEARFDDLCIDAVPTRHWSMRTPRDRNRSLWCGWVVRSAGLRFWFSGDSENLLEIASRLGPFNLAALPIGAWAPKWFMASQHMDPHQAVALRRAAGRPLTEPIHCGGIRTD